MRASIWCQSKESQLFHHNRTLNSTPKELIFQKEARAANWPIFYGLGQNVLGQFSQLEDADLEKKIPVNLFLQFIMSVIAETVHTL